MRRGINLDSKNFQSFSVLKKTVLEFIQPSLGSFVVQKKKRLCELDFQWSMCVTRVVNIFSGALKSLQL